MTWTILAEVLKALGGLIAVLSFPFALLTYARSVRTRRAEWLASLHEKFFESDRYREIRRVLDYRREPEYADLIKAITSHDFIMSTLRLQGFERLADLLEAVVSCRAPDADTGLRLRNAQGTQAAPAPSAAAQRSFRRRRLNLGCAL